jgi:hypothetical protein
MAQPNARFYQRLRTKAGIRFRAYELYEQRGKADGHALDDWLQVEAELTGQQALSVAA